MNKLEFNDIKEGMIIKAIKKKDNKNYFVDRIINIDDDGYIKYECLYTNVEKQFKDGIVELGDYLTECDIYLETRYDTPLYKTLTGSNNNENN